MSEPAAPVRPEVPKGLLPRFATVRDLAAALGIGERAARMLCEGGKVPAFRLGKSWYIDPERFAAFVREKEREAREAPERKAEAVRDALDVVLRRGRNAS